ncbi:hypothetical protein BDQ17DRAFT_1367936 [Cyathus striatus]|nr:hypothetical protein BDQ17DRAFT_1367936 [Cyathus striatus]
MNGYGILTVAAGSPHRDIFLNGLQGSGLVKPKEGDVIRDLKLYTVAHDAFRALVNLSDSPLVLPSLSDTTFIHFIVSYIINPHSILADLASMLLSNLTASSSACSAMLKLKIPVIPDKRLSNGLFPVDSRSGSCPSPVPYPQAEAKEVLALPLLVDAFVEGAQMDEGDLSKRTRKGSLNFLASVFANVTVSPAGRTFFLTPQPNNQLDKASKKEYPLSKLVAFTEHTDTIRRGGVASTIKNCSFQATGHKAILSQESELVSIPLADTPAPGIDALPYLLLPLAGPEEFDFEDQEKLPEAVQLLPPDKKREQDPAIRLTFVETLLLLCHTRWGRDYQRDHGVYEIVRAAHAAEKVDKIAEHIERLVQLLKGDEPKVANVEEEDAPLEEEELAKKPAVVPSLEHASEPAAVNLFGRKGGQGGWEGKGKEEESDDEDYKIEEV